MNHGENIRDIQLDLERAIQIVPMTSKSVSQEDVILVLIQTLHELTHATDTIKQTAVRFDCTKHSSRKKYTIS